MFWQEDNSKDKSQIPGDILDVSFKIECKALPVSHAHLLSQALVKALPWLETESKAAIHQVYLPEAGNGWMRSSDPNEVIYLSGRSKLILRVPKEKLEDTHRLSGETLDLGAFKIKVGKGKEKPLSVTTTLTCRYIESDPQEAEDVFLKRVIG